MAQYANLKDYFLGEHIELIKNTVKQYIEQAQKVECKVSTACVKSLACINDDAMFNVEYEIGVSADIVVGAETCSRSFIITITGNLEQRLDDIKVIGVKALNEDDFPEDNLLSQFILPNLPESEVERIGSEMFLAYQKRGVFDDCHLSLERLIQKEPIFFSPLPDNCLGRIMLTEADVEVVINNLTVQHQAIPGTILLNKKKYADEHAGSLMITIAHELAHWWFHQRFFKVLLLLGEESIDLISSTDMATTNDSTTDIQKALSIAEVQADELAMRLAIPQSTVDATIAEIATDPTTHYENLGDMMQACVNKFAKLYNVSPLVAKERLRQLGYDYVDGTCLEYEENGKKIQPAPFYFQPGTLKGNETFVIDRDNYERLLRENKDFAKLIESKICVYTGYVVCLYDAKYIKPAVNNGQVSYELTDYAREHADECCLFYTLSSSQIISNYTYYGQKYLCNVTGSVKAEYSYDENDQWIISREIQSIIDRRKRDVELYENIIQKGIKSFPAALTYIMDEAHLTKELLADRIECDPRTIQKYRNSQTPESIEKVLLFCLGCQTGPKVSKFLIEKSVGGIPDIGMKKTAYEFLLENTDTNLEIWNTILKGFNLPPLRMKNSDS